MRDVTVEASPSEATQLKVGTYVGVLAPALLLSTSVVLFRRLGLIVSVGALGDALLAITGAHFIAVCAGVSLASAATNSTVRPGARHALLGRSLGAPVGGSITLAFYLGLALLVALHAHGLAEVARIALPQANPKVVASAAIVGFGVLGLSGASLTLRLASAAVPIVVVAVASIAIGAAGVEPSSAIVPLGLTGDASRLSRAFLLYFPAASGIVAAIAFTSKLSIPGRSIPVGSIVATVVAWLISGGLAVFYALAVPARVLASDLDVATSVAFDGRVVALGASTAIAVAALVALAGASRLLLDLARDGVVLRRVGLSARGEGWCLLLTLGLVEIAVLLGDFERLSAVTSMVFLAGFGLASVACAVERWANPDFRPRFTAPVWVSAVGAAACLLVMAEISILATASLLALTGFAYAWARRGRQVRESGATWAGVWAAVVRFGLQRLGTGVARGPRGWRPNMVAVSMETPRDELITLSKSIVGGRGLLTHFTLVEDGTNRSVIDASLQQSHPGMFARVSGCNDAYEALPNIAASFGLVGMETNVVMLGWPRHETRHDAFLQMYERLVALDLNVLLMRFDTARAFGRRAHVDVWWDGREHTGQLMLSLAHLLKTSGEWGQARVRVLVIGDPEWDHEHAERTLDASIREARVDAEGVLLPPLAARDSVRDRMRKESAGADLVVVGMPDLRRDGRQGFAERANELMAPWGTTVLVRAARADANTRVVFRSHLKGTQRLQSAALGFAVRSPADGEVARHIVKLEVQIREALEAFERETEAPFGEEEQVYLRRIVELTGKVGLLERRLGRQRARRFVVRGHLDGVKSRFSDAVVKGTGALTRGGRPSTGAAQTKAWAERHRDGLRRLRHRIAEAVETLPEQIEVPTTKDQWLAAPQGDLRPWLHRAWARMRIAAGGASPPRRIPLRAMAERHMVLELAGDLGAGARALGARRFDVIRRARMIAGQVDRFIGTLHAELDRSGDPDVDLGDFRQTFTHEVDGLTALATGQLERFEESMHRPSASFHEAASQAASRLVDAIDLPDGLQASHRTGAQFAQASVRELDELGHQWARQHLALAEALQLDLHALSLAIEARKAASAVYDRVRQDLEKGPLASLGRAEAIVTRVQRLASQPPDERLAEGVLKEAYVEAADQLRATWDTPMRPRPRELIDEMLVGLGRAVERLPASVSTLNDEDLARAAAGDSASALTTVPARRLAQAFLEEAVIAPARRAVEPLTEVYRAAQSALVDSCRLVAFELEHALDTPEEDGDDEGLETSPRTVAETIVERLPRLVAAREAVEAYLTALQSELLDETGRAVERTRQVISGAAKTAPADRRRTGRIAARIERVVSGARRRLLVLRLRLGRRRTPGAPRRDAGQRTTTDQVLELRERLRADADVAGKLPLIYRRLFGPAPLDASDLAVGRGPQLEQATTLVERWHAGAAGPIGIIGDPRSGRSTLASIMAREVVTGRTVVRIRPSDGATATRESLDKAVAAAVGAREGQSAEGALRMMPPGAVLIVEDLGRWVERTPRGLTALEHWMRLWRRLGGRHLFIVTMTPFVWSYAGLLRDLPQRFLGTMSATSLSVAELQELLLLRHRTSGLELELSVAGSRRFARGRRQASAFARIYELTGGNVGAAIDLWRRSIVRASDTAIEVRIPAVPDRGVLARLPPRWYAGLVAVFIHRAVSVARMARVMRMSRDDATSLLSDLERASLVAVDRSGKYRLDPVLLPMVLAALRTRGLLP